MINRFICVFCCFFSFNTMALQAGTVHCIATGDTSDVNINASVCQSISTVLEMFGEVALNLKMEYEPQVIVGNDLTNENVYYTLKNLQSTEEDVLVFYYNGHGFNTEKNVLDTPWPVFYYTQAKELFLFDLAKNILLKKPYKTLLVVSDCCNYIIQMEKNTSSTSILCPYSLSAPKKINKKQLQNLFLNKKQTIFATSAKRGQTAFATATKGGLFTYNFKKVFEGAVKGNNASWESILSSTKSATSKSAKMYEEIQTPYYEIK